MALKSVAPGLFTIPTAPSKGTVVAQSASADTYGSYVEAIASTSANLFVSAIQISASTSEDPEYVNVQIGVGSAGNEVIVGQAQISPGNKSTVVGSILGTYILLNPWIAIPSGSRIALKTASDVASAINWNVSLQCINQADVIDAGVSESAAVVTNADKTGYSLSASQTFNTTGSVGSVTGNVGGNVNGSILGVAFGVQSPVVAVSPRGTRL